jgi:hypothetical protein
MVEHQPSENSGAIGCSPQGVTCARFAAENLAAGARIEHESSLWEESRAEK